MLNFYTSVLVCPPIQTILVSWPRRPSLWGSRLTASEASHVMKIMTTYDQKSLWLIWIGLSLEHFMNHLQLLSTSLEEISPINSFSLETYF